DVSDFANSLRNYGVALPYATTVNPVIFAARPGTRAPASLNPIWQTGSRVGPIAARASRLAIVDETSAERRPLAILVRDLAEYRGTGQIDTKGTISWSDLDGFEAAVRVAAPSPERSDGVTVSELVPPSPTMGVVSDFAWTSWGLL